MPSIHHIDVPTLAKDFASVIAAWLTAEQRKEVVQANAAEADKRICHSHDYCDANQAMIDALEMQGAEFDAQDEEQGAAIDAAWNLAKGAGFWFEERSKS